MCLWQELFCFHAWWRSSLIRKGGTAHGYSPECSQISIRAHLCGTFIPTCALFFGCCWARWVWDRPHVDYGDHSKKKRFRLTVFCVGMLRIVPVHTGTHTAHAREITQTLMNGAYSRMDMCQNTMAKVCGEPGQRWDLSRSKKKKGHTEESLHTYGCTCACWMTSGRSAFFEGPSPFPSNWCGSQ